jgi:two-component system, response regulator PdtaR
LGEQAVAAAEQHRPDLIIMDISLEGGTDGVDAAREIRSRIGIRSLFFTGVSDPQTRQRAIAADPIAFLDKTSSPDQLRQVIAAIELR